MAKVSDKDSQELKLIFSKDPIQCYKWEIGGVQEQG